MLVTFGCLCHYNVYSNILNYLVSYEFESIYHPESPRWHRSSVGYFIFNSSQGTGVMKKSHPSSYARTHARTHLKNALTHTCRDHEHTSLLLLSITSQICNLRNAGWQLLLQDKRCRISQTGGLFRSTKWLSGAAITGRALGRGLGCSVTDTRLG